MFGVAKLQAFYIWRCSLDSTDVLSRLSLINGFWFSHLSVNFRELSNASFRVEVDQAQPMFPVNYLKGRRFAGIEETQMVGEET